MQLRDYQQRGVADIRAAFRAKKKRPLFVLPTGGGKTATFVYIANSANSRGNRVLITVHRVELLRQTSAALDRMGVPHGIIAPGYKQTREGVQVCMVQTMQRRLEKLQFQPDLIIVDEAHHATAGQWLSIIKAYPDAHVLGVTATPVRSDGKPLGDVFDTMIEGPTIRELIAQQHLVKPVVFCPPVLLDTTGVRKRGGDYASGDLAAATNKPAITGDAVAHYRKLLNGAPAIAFCASVKHAEDVAEDFRRQGFRWAAVHGDMEPEDRRRTLDELGRGLLNGVSSCDVISEGTDIPAVHAAILLRKTESVGLYLQQVGRALRPAPGKERAIIIDHVGNIGRMEGGKFVPKHDLPDVDREWSLDGEENGRPRSASGSKVKNCECPKCYEVHDLAPRCPNCGHVYNYEQEHRVIDAELHHVDDEQRVQAEHHAKVERRRMVAEAKTGEDLARIAKMYGHKPGWIYHMAALKGISLR